MSDTLPVATGDTDIVAFKNLISHQSKQVVEAYSGVKVSLSLPVHLGPFLKQ